MAIENKVILNGQINGIRAVTNDDGEVALCTIGLHVIRRPQPKLGNQKGDIRNDVVLVHVQDPDMIKYLSDHRATTGDMMEVVGVLCTKHGPKSYICKECGAKNTYDGTTCYVHPLCIRLVEIHPKRFETVLLSPAERHGKHDVVMNTLVSKKTLPGQIIGIKALEQDKETGAYPFMLTVREPLTGEDVMNSLMWVSEISNRIFAIGNLCEDPEFTQEGNGPRVCTYQLGINRKVFIKEDDPVNRADFPWIKSFGDQAEKDRDCLTQGSLVYIDGSIQVRENFTVKRECENCGAINHLKGKAVEIVPYSVEYLRNCILPSDEEEGIPLEDVNDEEAENYAEDEEEEESEEEAEE